MLPPANLLKNLPCPQCPLNIFVLHAVSPEQAMFCPQRLVHQLNAHKSNS